MRQLHLYFSYGSSYSYLAWARIRKVHPQRYADAEVLWKPVRFGRLMELQGHDGSGPANQTPYALIDSARWGHLYGVPFRYPESYPIDSSICAKAHLLAELEGPRAELAMMDGLFEAHWEQGLDISDRAVLEAIAKKAGVPRLGDRLDSEGVAKLLEANTVEATAVGAPGVPYAVLGGEGFWGNDRLDWVETLLQEPGQDDDAQPSARHVLPMASGHSGHAHHGHGGHGHTHDPGHDHGHGQGQGHAHGHKHGHAHGGCDHSH